MAKYLLLLHLPRDIDKGLSPSEIQAIIQKYSDWRARLERDRRFLAGQKLRDDGRVLRRQGSQVSVTDGPYGEAKEVLAGYFLVEADSYEQTVEMAKAGPHLQRGTVEIREVEHHG